MKPFEISNLRKQLGMTQSKFGELLGSEQATISRWENGLWEPNAHQVKLLQGFKKASEEKDDLKDLLVGLGLIAALALILSLAAKKSGGPK